jgi:hypothetical protein
MDLLFKNRVTASQTTLFAVLPTVVQRAKCASPVLIVIAQYKFRDFLQPSLWANALHLVWAGWDLLWFYENIAMLGSKVIWFWLGPDNRITFEKHPQTAKLCSEVNSRDCLRLNVILPCDKTVVSLSYVPLEDAALSLKETLIDKAPKEVRLENIRIQK